MIYIFDPNKEDNNNNNNNNYCRWNINLRGVSTKLNK